MARVMLKSVAYNHICKKILHNELLPGESIVEEEISEQLNISRTPVREALKQLEAEGLVYRIPERGTFVRELTIEDIDEICELRKLFELHALKYCVEKVTDQDILDCRESLEALDNNSQLNQFYDSNESFHRMIFKYCTNKRMLGFLKVINTQLQPLRRLLENTPHRLEKTKKDHLYLLDILQERNYEKIAGALAKHLDLVKKVIIDIYQQSKMEH